MRVVVLRSEGPLLLLPLMAGGAGVAADEEEDDEGRAYRGDREWLGDWGPLRPPRKAASMAKAEVFAILPRRSVDDEESVAAIKSSILAVCACFSRFALLI